MANYYCLMAGLPEVKLGDARPQRTILEMKEELSDILESQDARLMQTYFLRFDCENLVSLLQGVLRLTSGEIEDTLPVVPNVNLDLGPLKDEVRKELSIPQQKPFNHRGNYSYEELQTLVEEARSMEGTVNGFPAFMADFVRDYDAHAEDRNWFACDAALLAYYDFARRSPNTMMAEWYELNFNILNILTALIARKQEWPLADYVQGSGPVVDAILKQAAQPDFGLSAELDYMKDLMLSAETSDPVEKERQIDALRWKWLEDKTFFEPFDITALFAFVVRCEILERWSMLDPEQGRQRFTEIIEELRGEARVPEEFIRK